MVRVRFRLRLGIAVVFVAVVLPLTMVMIGVLYQRNAQQAQQMAEQSMEIATREAGLAVTGLIGDLTNAVELSAAFGRAQQDAIRRPESLRPLLDELERLPTAYSLYFGLQEDGEFYQVVRLNEEVKRFGPRGAPPPAEAKWVIRTVESGTGERRDTYLYLSGWGKVVKVERADPTYDPRKRPWYDIAMSADKVASSGVYIFSGTGKPGLTLSRRLVSDDGVKMGVFAADMSISSLAGFLRERKVGRTGITFILDGEGQLIGYPDADKSVIEMEGKVALVKGEQVQEPAVAEAVRRWHAGGGNSFKVESGGTTWLAHFSAFPERFGRRWTVGVVVDEDDFVGPLKRASAFIVGIGLVFISLATFGVVAASRLLVRPIHDLIAETERIRQFELDGPIKVRSPVLEIDLLSSALASMKAGLASFGHYVPKSLVHDIIRSGMGTAVGGIRRPLTVMFSDLQGFAAATERMEPEQVLLWLSSYFDAMSQAIDANHGTIDKYIGDAVMALWNAPVEDADHVDNACRAMLACREVGRRLNSTGNVSLTTRMGLHTGTAMVGNLGSRDRMQYTALGGVVNLASRIEGLNKHFGTELMVTDAVARAVDGRFLLRPFGPVLVAGTTIPLSVFELLGEQGDDHPGLALWMSALEAWHANRWAEAAEGFGEYLSLHPGDAAAKYFQEMSLRFAAQGAPADWDGVIKFSSK